jgi:uncharacterized protein YycO
MKHKFTNLLLVVAVVAMLFNAQPVLAGGRGPFDLSVDTDGNNVSDVIEQEVQLLATLPEDQQSAAIQEFVARLPISDYSKALQKRASLLTSRLSTANPKQAQLIIQELAKITAELNTDPVIAKTLVDLQKLTGDISAPHSMVAPDDASLVAPAVAFSSLRKGDIMARRSGWLVLWPWAKWYEHTGNYYGNSQVYESNSDGVRLKPLSQWQTRGHYIGLARNKWKSSTTMSNAVNWAYTKYGNGRTSYNYNFVDKWTDSRLYCSQLSWKINKQAGTDLDSNHWSYHLWASALYGSWILAVIIPAVAPDEVMLDSDVNVYSAGWN